MKYLLLIVLFCTTLVLASSFKNIKKLSNIKLNSISDVAKEVVSNDKIFGDCGSVDVFKIKKTKYERNINTIKQLLVVSKKLDAGNDEQEYVSEIKPTETFSMTKTLLDFTMDNQVEDWLNNEEDFSTYKDYEKRLANSLYLSTDKLTNSHLRFYQSIHSDEDGTWNSLVIYDTREQEALVLTVGFCST